MTTSATTLDLVEALRDAGQDFEWYPTKKGMVDAVLADLDERCESILDIGAGDGRVLMMLAQRHDRAKLFAIEKSPLLQQAQPNVIIPVGSEFAEQDLMSLPVDLAFCNPPYSEFDEWAHRIITTVHTHRLYLVLPQRWQDSDLIRQALKVRAAEAEVIHADDFHNAERRARAVVHVIRVTFTGHEDGSYNGKPQDPFDLWFDQNINTFEQEADLSDYEQEQRALARLHHLETIGDLVAAFDEEYARMQEHYKAIFKLDAALLKELGVNKEGVREGLKKRMQGLKHTYWHALFIHLDVVTSRLTTKTKKRFLDRLTGQTGVAFTTSNAYAVVLWALKAANQYFDEQVVDVFRELSTHDGVSNYVSNQRTWEKDGFRYNAERDKVSHYTLDYRIVLHHYRAIHKSGEFNAYDYPGHLHNSCHEIIDDLIAVLGNLGFLVVTRVPKQDGVQFAHCKLPSRLRGWMANDWQDFETVDGTVIFQVKAFINGHLHLRFRPEALKALNIEAGRLLGWVRGPADVVAEMGYTPEEAARFFGSSQRLGAASVKRLCAGAAPAESMASVS